MENQILNTGFTFSPFALILCGAVIRYIIGRRRFNRRGIGGLQQYSSYWVAVLTTITEWLLKWAANALIIFGIITMIISI